MTWLARAALLLASLALGLALAEGALLLRHRAQSGPGSWVKARGFDSPYLYNAAPGRGDINDLSIRRETPTEVRAPAGTLRVLSYGDSVAQGFSLTQRESYPQLLEDRLDAQAPPRVEVLNMFRGHSPSAYAFHLRRDVPLLAPDAVLLEIELLNDVSDEVFVDAEGADEFGLPTRLLRTRYMLGLDGHLLAPSARDAAPWQRSLVAVHLRRWLERRRSRQSDNPVFGPDGDTAWYATDREHHLLTQTELDLAFDRLFDSVLGIQRYLRARGVGFLLVIMPSRDVYEEGRFAQGARRLLARAEARAARDGIDARSLRAELGAAGGAALFIDFCHPDAAGSAAIARALEQPVRELLARRPAG